MSKTKSNYITLIISIIIVVFIGIKIYSNNNQTNKLVRILNNANNVIITTSDSVEHKFEMYEIMGMKSSPIVVGNYNSKFKNSEKELLGTMKIYNNDVILTEVEIYNFKEIPEKEIEKNPDMLKDVTVLLKWNDKYYSIGILFNQTMLIITDKEQ